MAVKFTWVCYYLTFSVVVLLGSMELYESRWLLFVQAAGKYKQEGKTYVVQDGDIIFFKFNVSGGGKK